MNKEQALDFFVGIFAKGNTEEIKAMFGFDDSTGNEEIVKKFRLFSALCFPKAYSLKSAEFHRQLETDLVASYIDGVKVCNMFFRDSGKTTKTKLFVAFVLLNDNRSKKREFIKILSKDLKNPKQIVTDVYNMIIDCRWIYGDVFMKEDDKKREETMTAFTMKDSRSLVSATIGQSQRGHMRNFTRPDCYYEWHYRRNRRSSNGYCS
jgi:hypothetical protein